MNNQTPPKNSTGQQPNPASMEHLKSLTGLEEKGLPPPSRIPPMPTVTPPKQK